MADRKVIQFTGSDGNDYDVRDEAAQQKIGTTALPTTAQTLTGAIAEHESDITNLTAEANSLKSAITDLNESMSTVSGFKEVALFKEGYYITTKNSTVNLSNYTASPGNYAVAIIDCTEGDKFLLKGEGAGTARLWCYVDNNYPVANSLLVADANAKADNLVIPQAPSGAAKLVINCKMSSEYYAVKGTDIPVKHIPTIENAIDALESNLGGLSDVFEDLSDEIDFVPAHTSPNIYNKNDSDIIDGGYIGSDGNIVENSSFFETGYIPCEYGDVLRCIYNGAFLTNTGVVIAFYNSSKTFIQTVNKTLNNIDITVSNTAYIRIPLDKNKKDLLMVTANNDQVIPYEPYGEIQTSCGLVNRVEALELVGKWNGKDCVCMGDSIMWYDGHKFDGTDIYAVGYPSYLRSVLGLTVNNQGVSGACIAYHSDRQYTDNVETVDDIDFSSYNLAILEGGVNDYITSSPLGALSSGSFDKTTFYGAYQYIIEKILTDNPTIQIVMFLPYKITWKTTANTQGLYLADYVEAIEKVAERYSIPLVDLYRNCGFNSFNIASQYTIDGLHANNAGYKRTNDILIDKVKNLGIISQDNN